MAKTPVLVQLFVIASLTQDSIAINLRTAGGPDISIRVPSGMHGKNCADKTAFHDEKGHDCSQWAGVWDCSKAVANYGYSAIGQQNLLDSCPGSCRVCVTTLDGQFVYPTKDEEAKWANWWKDNAAVSMNKMWVSGYGDAEEAKNQIEAVKKKEEAKQKAQEAKVKQDAAAKKAAQEKAEAAAKQAVENAAAYKAAAEAKAAEKRAAVAKAAEKAAAEKAAEEKKAAEKKEAEKKAAEKKKAEEAEAAEKKAAEKKAAEEKAAAEKTAAEKKAKEAAAKKAEEDKSWFSWR